MYRYQNLGRYRYSILADTDTPILVKDRHLADTDTDTFHKNHEIIFIIFGVK